MATLPRKIVVVTVLLLGVATTASGSGFGVFTQGAAALAQANSVIAHADGPSAVFFNPALLTTLPGTRLEAGVTLIFPTHDYTSPDGTPASTRDRLFTPGTVYLTHSFTDKLTAGLGVFNPFGLGTDWGSDWGGSEGGRFLATKTTMTSWNINPVLAYRLFPGVSLAAGPDIVLLETSLEKRAQPPVDHQKIDASGSGVGYNLGLYLELPRGISLGAAYRSQVHIDLKGDSTSDLFPSGIGIATAVTLPQQMTAGVAMRPTDRVTLEAGFRWEDWSSFRSLNISFDSNPYGLTTIMSPHAWHSTYAVNVGGSYRVNDTVSLMAGYFHGWNPVPDSTFEPSVPDSDSNSYTVGGEVHLDRFTVALGYCYQMWNERYKGANLFGDTGNGRYHTYFHLAGISLGYRF